MHDEMTKEESAKLREAFEERTKINNEVIAAYDKGYRAGMRKNREIVMKISEAFTELCKIQLELSE